MFVSVVLLCSLFLSLNWYLQTCSFIHWNICIYVYLQLYVFVIVEIFLLEKRFNIFPLDSSIYVVCQYLVLNFIPRVIYCWELFKKPFNVRNSILIMISFSILKLDILSTYIYEFFYWCVDRIGTDGFNIMTSEELW